MCEKNCDDCLEDSTCCNGVFHSLNDDPESCRDTCINASICFCDCFCNNYESCDDM